MTPSVLLFPRSKKTPVIRGRLLHITKFVCKLEKHSWPALDHSFSDSEQTLPSAFCLNDLGFLFITTGSSSPADQKPQILHSDISHEWPWQSFSSLWNFINQASTVSIFLNAPTHQAPTELPTKLFVFISFTQSKISEMSIIFPKIWPGLPQWQPTLWNQFLF